MKIMLSLIICSTLAGECLEPHIWHENFRTHYDCLEFGYEESLKKLKEIGRTDINQYGMYIKFTCLPDPSI